MIDWTQALRTQDQSLEGSMARSSLLKDMEPLLRAQALAQQKQQREAELQQQAQEFQTRMAETKALRDETMRRTKQTEADRVESMKTSRANMVHDNLKAGDRMSVTDPDYQLLKERGGANQFTADPNDPDYVIYLKHAYDVAVADKTKKEALSDAEEKRRVRDQQIQEERLQMERDRVAQETQMRTERLKALKQKNADADKVMEDVTKAAPDIAKETQGRIAAKLARFPKKPDGGFLGFGGQSEQDIQEQAAQIVSDEWANAREQLRARQGKPPSAGSQSQTGRGGPPPQTEEQTKALAAKLGIPYVKGMTITQDK